MFKVSKKDTWTVSMTLMTSTALTSQVFFKYFCSWLCLLVFSLLIKISNLLLFPPLLVYLAAIYFFRSTAWRYLYYPRILSHSPFLFFIRFQDLLGSSQVKGYRFEISVYRYGKDMKLVYQLFWMITFRFESFRWNSCLKKNSSTLMISKIVGVRAMVVRLFHYAKYRNFT